MTDTNNILYRAAAIKTNIATLEAEYDMMKEQVIAEVAKLTADAEKQSVEVGEFGAFSLASFRTWKYSAATETAEKTLKKMKKQEEADGTAEATEKKIVKFIIKK